MAVEYVKGVHDHGVGALFRRSDASLENRGLDSKQLGLEGRTELHYPQNHIA
jgi:hypothetical protein